MKIPFKSVLTHFKNIEIRNEKFHSLSDEQQRKEIAFDSLTLLIEKKVKASRNSIYWSYSLKQIRSISNTEFQQKLVNELPKCEVCARGAMMLSQIRLGNNISCNETNRDEGDRYIVKGFTMDDFYNMESYYEGWEGSRQPYSPKSAKRLANICCNVIANGNFTTSDKTDYLTKWNIKIN